VVVTVAVSGTVVVTWVFFWFIHYSHATYQNIARFCTVRLLPAVRAVFFVYSYLHSSSIDHGGVHFARFSCPQSARWRPFGSSPSPSAQACPKK